MQEKGKEAIEEAVELIVEKLKVNPEEVAVLLYYPQEESLKFVYPSPLVDAGSIPITSSDSLAVRVMKSAKGFLSNNFQDVRHLGFFDRLTRNKGPILKLLAAPILKGGRVIGVIEVSCRQPARNFTQEELLFLEQVGELLGERLEEP